MEVIDAQIHPPPIVLPIDAEHGAELQMVLRCEMAREAMDAVGVDVAVVNSEQQLLDCFVARYPDRFAGCASLDVRTADLAGVVATYRDRPGMLAIRVHIVDWTTKTLRPEFRSGDLEPAFAEAERSGVPLFCSAMGVAKAIGPVAKAHPDLTLIVDHLGLSSPPPMARVDPDPWSGLPDVLALARFPNVSLKLSGMIALSSERYPYRDLWPRLHRVIDAFGPDRLLWGSDYTRLRMGVGTTDRAPRQAWGGLYSDAVTYLRDTSELSQEDKEKLFSGTIRRLLRWPREV